VAAVAGAGVTAADLAALARRWNRLAAAGALVAAAALGLLAGVAALRPGGLAPARALMLGAGAAALAFAAARRRRAPVPPDAIARHLDRTVPALEDSTELLLIDEAALAPLARLQRRRVLATLDLLPVPALPHRPLRRALRVAAGLLAAAAALALWPAGAGPAARGLATAGGPAAAAAPAVPRIGDVTIVVEPPAYTRRATRRAGAWDLDTVPAGARVSWRIAIGGTVQSAALVTSAGDSIALRPDGPGRFAGALVPEASRLYQVVARGPGGRVATAYHRLIVLADAAPVVTVIRPDLRTTLPPGVRGPVAIEVLASDDYGIASADIVATVTTGRGEGVRFREERLAFDRRERRPGGGWLLRRALDLAAFGLGPGDELYFSVVARDTRTPEPNETRSETHFVTITDTVALVIADFSGLALEVVPEYFRSQRQIIIDTERLLGERAGLRRQTFRDRSQNIGIDQHLLRLRYGEMVGDETTGGDPLAADETGLPGEHQHDTEDNATRLARTVKETLKAALAEMWEAELRLRTYDPAGALPYEYRALELLKQVQQAARVYVRRTGFEPAPLEADRTRLSGDLEGIGDRTRRRARARGDSLPAVRSGLDAAAALARGVGRPPEVARAIEAAGREVARLATDDPGRHLETLGALRRLLTALERDGTPCAGCLERVARGLWAALPAPAAAPGPPLSPGAAGGVARAYFDLLGTLP
jgi:hypothetical protein